LKKVIFSLQEQNSKKATSPQLLLIQGDEGDIGRFHPTIKEGDTVSNDDKSVLVRLTFKTLASLQVFQEEVAALNWVRGEAHDE